MFRITIVVLFFFNSSSKLYDFYVCWCKIYGCTLYRSIELCVFHLFFYTKYRFYFCNLIHFIPYIFRDYLKSIFISQLVILQLNKKSFTLNDGLKHFFFQRFPCLYVVPVLLIQNWMTNIILIYQQVCCFYENLLTIVKLKTNCYDFK